MAAPADMPVIIFGRAVGIRRAPNASGPYPVDRSHSLVLLVETLEDARRSQIFIPNADSASSVPSCAVAYCVERRVYFDQIGRAQVGIGDDFPESALRGN